MGWVANIFLLIGLVGLGKKWKHAFLFTAVGEVLWVVESVLIARWDMITLCAVFAVLALWNWVVWNRPVCQE